MKVRLILKPKSNSNTIRRNEKDWLATENEDLDMSGLKKKLQVAIEARESDVVEIVKREIARREGKRNGKSNSREYTCQFWEPGLVSYEDSGAGVALLRKETMDAMLPSMIGAPVVIDHMDGSAEEIKNSGKSVGTVTNAYWNPETGWYECTFTADTSDAEEKINDGWSVSCAFDVSEETGPGGEYHAMQYDEEIKSGTFTHLALVQTPRYEDSRIFKNTKKLFLNSKKARLIVKMNARILPGDSVQCYMGLEGWKPGKVETIETGKDGKLERIVCRLQDGGQAEFKPEDIKKNAKENAIDAQKIRAIEAMLANDEASSDAELVEHFMKELGLTQQEAQAWVSKRGQYLKNAKENAKTVAISIPYRTIADVADKKGISESELEQMLVGKGLIPVGAGGGTADYEFHGSESQAASTIRSVLGTMSGVDLGMIQNSKENSDASNKTYDSLLKEIQSIHVMTKEKAEAMIVKIENAPGLSASEKDSLEYNLGKQRARSHGKRNDSPGDFGTLLREIKEQLYQIAQAVGQRFAGKDNKKQCPQCEGSGQVDLRGRPVPCSKCGGLGELPEGKENSTDKVTDKMLEWLDGQNPHKKDRAAIIADFKKQFPGVGSPAAEMIVESYLDYRGNSKDNAITTVADNIVKHGDEFLVGWVDELQTKIKSFKTLDEAEKFQSEMRQRVGKENQKSSRAILKTASKNKKENNSMFGFFKRKKKENAAPVEEKLPVDQIDIEIDGVAVPLAELVNEYKAEQAEIAERNRLEKEAAAKAENAEPNPEKPAEEKPAGDQPAPEDLDLENQDFTVEDGSRYNMSDLINCWTKRKAAKQNAGAEEKAKEGIEKEAKENSYGNFSIASDLAKGMSPEEVVKRIMARYSDIKEPQARGIVEAVQKGGANAEADWKHHNAQETPEQKAEREKKEADDKAAKENAAKAEEETKAKENAKKRNPAYFHKLNDLKNDADEVTGKVIDTLSDRIARGNSRYGSKK